MKNINLKSAATCFFFALYVSISPLAYANGDFSPDQVENPQILTLKKDQKAPFDGTFFSTSASAKLIVDLEFNEETCKIETERQLSLLDAKLKLDLDLLQSKYDSLESRHDEVIKIKNDQIDFLETKIKPRPWYASGEFLFGMGVLGGILVTVAAGYALGQASK
tara:strand:+ start:242 stop:733 length:492 start_codon:yes stop_codon:yes gene_type:complete